MKSKFFHLLILVLFVNMLLAGCYYSAPPGIDKVQEHFDQNTNEIQVVVGFLENSEYENVYITESNGKMFADLSNERIEDPCVVMAVDYLLENNKFYTISKRGNTIHFLQWKGLQDIGCGIAYTINKIDLPQVQYATNMIQLSDDGWYYYVADYELWKTQKIGSGPVS